MTFKDLTKWEKEKLLFIKYSSDYLNCSLSSIHFFQTKAQFYNNYYISKS